MNVWMLGDELNEMMIWVCIWMNEKWYNVMMIQEAYVWTCMICWEVNVYEYIGYVEWDNVVCDVWYGWRIDGCWHIMWHMNVHVVLCGHVIRRKCYEVWRRYVKVLRRYMKASEAYMKCLVCWGRRHILFYCGVLGAQSYSINLIHWCVGGAEIHKAWYIGVLGAQTYRWYRWYIGVLGAQIYI